MADSLRKLVRACLFTAVLAGSASTASAADWMFEHSYYSHANSPGYVNGTAPRSRSAYRPAYLGGHQKFAIRGGIRMNTIVIWNGDSVDRTIIRENWNDVNY